MLDIQNFLWLQKLEKFRPGENMKKQVRFFFFFTETFFPLIPGSPDQTLVNNLVSQNRVFMIPIIE